MALFNNLFKKGKPKTNQPNSLAMVLFPGTESFLLNRFLEDVYANYGYQIEKGGSDDISGAFVINGISVSFMNMNFPVPAKDIEATAQYAYNWKTATEELENHQGHFILVIDLDTQNAISCFKLRSELICSVLRTTDALGVYDGDQSLLISKSEYLIEFKKMSNTLLPLNLWVYFGLRTFDGKNHGYTYGMKAFGKADMEIIDSDLPFVAIRERLWNVTNYVLLNDITFSEGQILGYTAEERIKITYSKAKFAGGYVFKLHY